MEAEIAGIKFTDADVVNPDDFIAAGEYNPHKIHPFLLHDHGFVVAVVFADCLQDAIDTAVDADKMGRYAIEEADLEEYGEDGVSYLGNFGKPFDIESLGVLEFDNPKFSFVALHNAGK